MDSVTDRQTDRQHYDANRSAKNLVCHSSFWRCSVGDRKGIWLGKMPAATPKRSQ